MNDRRVWCAAGSRRLIVFVVLAALALSACGSSGSASRTGSGSSSSAATRTTVKTEAKKASRAKTSGARSDPSSTAMGASATSQDPKCSAIDLGIHFVGFEGATAMLISTFEFINVSTHECHLTGYPGAAAYDRQGRLLRVKALREFFPGRPSTGGTPAMVRLAPGGHASFQTQTPAFRPADQRCVTTYRLLFTPPNDYWTLSIRHTLLVCAGRIVIGPVTR